MKPLRVLVTGASGFIGRRLLDLAPGEWEVTALWNRTPLEDPRAIQCNLADHSSLGSIPREYDVVIALAANGDPAISLEDPMIDLERTAIVSLNTFRTFSARRLIYFSSGAVYEGASGTVGPDTPVRPTLPYAITHLAAERYAEHYTGKNFDESVVVRFFGAYGPHEPERKIYTRLIRRFSFEKKNTITLRGDGENIIDAMYVDDAIRAIRAMITTPVRNGYRIVDLPGGNPMTIRELTERAASSLGVKNLSIQYEGAATESHAFRANLDAFSAEYSFRPGTTLEEGIVAYKHWLQG